MTEKPTYEELEQRIKELEQAEIKLKRSEELFRGLFDNMTSGSAIYEVINDGLKGSDYIVKEFNNKSFEIEGKTFEQVIGKTLFDLRPNIDDYGLIPVMKQVWETGISAYYPVKLYRDNNFSNYYENYIFKIPSGEIVTIYNDITIQKNQELAIQESKERFDLAMQFTNDGLFDWNLETNQIHYSSGWKRMLGYNDDEIKDEFSEWERLTKFEDMKASWDMMNEVLEGKRDHFEKEFKMQHKDGHWVDILSRANVVFNKEGKGVRVVGTHVDITERRRIEEELRVSVIKHKTILEALPVGVTVSDDVGNILESNNAAQKILGLSTEEYLKRKRIQGDEWNIIMEDGSSMPSDEFASVRALNERSLVENVVMGVVKEDNKVTWISVSSTPIHLEGYGVVIAFSDINERKQAEDALRESERKYRLIAENSSDVIFTLDMNLCYTYVSPAVYKMRGFYPEEVINRRILDTLTPESLERVSSFISEQLKTQEKESNPIAIDLEMLCKDGGTVWAEVKGTFLRDDNGNITGILGVSRNITERKQIEQSLYESEARFKALHNASFGGIAIHDRGVILDCNQGLSEITGYSMTELIGMDGLLLIAERARNLVMQNILSGYEKPYEAIGLRKNGEEYQIRLEGRNIPYKGKNARVVEFRDITEIKQIEIKQKELDAANLILQKAESLSQMAGGIAHLFNNYLYAVTGNLELALEDLVDDSLIRNNLTEAMNAARRCADVAGSMLHYLGQNFVKTQSLDMSEFCRKILLDSQSQSSVNSRITIETEMMDAELPVRVNASQMQQVLNHLITNACESIGEKKGRITLITKIISASDIPKIHLLPVDSKPSADTYACVEITDTGCGISKEDLHKISDPFFTTKFTGRGLGLAVVSGIVKSWDGFIGVRSKVGHGSTFMVFIPLSDDNSIRQSKRLAQSPQPQKRELSTVLLVDDNTAVLKMTTIMLKKMGFEVISSLNGVEAVEKFRQHKESINCLITDLSMPELDGWGTLAAIRKIKPDIPAVLASGYDEAFAMSSDDSEKPQAFLHKPYTMKDLKIVFYEVFKDFHFFPLI